jgi:hypothetical protein
MSKKSTKQLYLALTVLDYIIATLFLFSMVILKLLMIPLSMIKRVMSAELPISDTRMEVKLINMIRNWVANHQSDIADVVETFGEKESYFIKITPEHNNAATLAIEVGFPQYLRVSIENFGIEFDEDEVDNGEKLIKDLLLSYENGEYYLKKWVYEGVVIDKCLVICVNKNKQYTSATDEFKIIRKLLAKVKMKNFMPIAASE